MGELCEILHYDGKSPKGVPCGRDAVGADGKGRHCCERHLPKVPDHVKKRRAAEKKERGA